jgi:hypothetical protein
MENGTWAIDETLSIGICPLFIGVWAVLLACQGV